MITFKDACKSPDEEHVNLFIQDAMHLPNYSSVKNANNVVFYLGPLLIDKNSTLLIKVLDIFYPAHILGTLHKPNVSNKDSSFNLYWFIICEYKLFSKVLLLYNKKENLSIYSACVDTIDQTIRAMYNLNEALCNLIGYCPKPMIPEKYHTILYTHILEFLETTYNKEITASLLEHINTYNEFYLFFTIVHTFKIRQQIYEEILSIHLIDDAFDDIMEYCYRNENALNLIESTFLCGKSIALMDSSLQRVFNKDKPKLYANLVSQLINDGKVKSLF